MIMIKVWRKIMKCIYCGNTESKVLDSRSSDDSNSIRRRRECLSCGKRFTTYETVETTPLLVIKSDNSRQQYDSEKLRGHQGHFRGPESRSRQRRAGDPGTGSGDSLYRNSGPPSLRR